MYKIMFGGRDMNGESSAPVESGNMPKPPPRRYGGSLLLPIVLFLLGILTGAMAFALFAILSKDPLIVRQIGTQADEVAQIREAARQGTLDGIATLQAGGGAQPVTPTPAVTPTPLPKDAFAVRDANRLGKADAPVTIVEYSDFQ